MQIAFHSFEGIGGLEIRLENDKITHILFRDNPIMRTQSYTSPLLDLCVKQLEEYFAGKRKTFDLPIHLEGTDFQLKVWEYVQKIPYGKIVSYAEIAESLLGGINFSRSVGLANSRNPIAIVVPCHRIVGKNGNLIGYPGGVTRKKFLLDFEAAQLQKEMLKQPIGY